MRQGHLLAYQVGIDMNIARGQPQVSRRAALPAKLYSAENIL